MKRGTHTRATDVLYKLVAIYYQCKSEARYPHFEVRHETIGYFHSLKDAERRVRQCIEDEEQVKISGGYRSDYYGFEIHEIPFDWHLTGWVQNTRIYLDNGTFLHEKKVSALNGQDWNGRLEPFKGRAKEECYFEVGDLVEVLRGDTVSLEIVYHLPPSPQRAEEIRQRVREDLHKNCPELTEDKLIDEMDWTLDITDDSYITLDGDEGYMENHSHPFTIQLFPARRKVPYMLRKKLERGLDIALKESDSYQY